MRKKPSYRVQLELCACVHVRAYGNSPVAELQTSHRGWQAVSTSLHLEAITHHHASARPHACSAPWTLAAFPLPPPPCRAKHHGRSPGAELGVVGCIYAFVALSPPSVEKPGVIELVCLTVARYGYGLRIPIPNACQCASSSTPWRSPFGGPVIGHPLAPKRTCHERNHGPWGGVIALGGFLHLPVVGVADLSSC